MSMEFSRPEYWSGEPFPSPGDLPNPGIKPRSPALQADSLPTELQGNPIPILLFTEDTGKRNVTLVPSPHLFKSRLLCPWNSPGKNTGVGCHSLPQGIFPTERSNSGLPHCGQTFFFNFIFLLYNTVLVLAYIDMNLGKLQETVKDRRAWHAVVCVVTKSWTQLSD